MSNNPKLKKNGGNGTFFGNLLRTAVKIGKPLTGGILGAIETGNPMEVIKAVTGSNEHSSEDKDLMLAGIQRDVEHERELTKRWELDSKSKDWLPRNIRPLVVANFTILIDVVILSSMWGKPLGEAYLPILMTMGITAIGGYFTLREYGKSKMIQK